MREALVLHRVVEGRLVRGQRSEDDDLGLLRDRDLDVLLQPPQQERLQDVMELLDELAVQLRVRGSVGLQQGREIEPLLETVQVIKELRKQEIQKRPGCRKSVGVPREREKGPRLTKVRRESSGGECR